MVIVTDKKYFIEKRLKEKLDIMINRMTKAEKDNLILIDGDEGDGKSNMATGIGYYVAYETNRPFNLKNIFFDLDKLLKFAIETKEQVIIWDEGALAGMAQEWWKKNQRKFIKLMMVARKRKHFWIICIPKFFKLNEYFVVDRSIGLIHVYLRHGVEYGRFVYFNEKKKEKLWQDWRRTKYRNYKKHYNFHGSFVAALKKIVDEDEYDKKKDEAILSIDKDEKGFSPQEFKKNIVIKALKKLKDFKVKLTYEQLMEVFDISYGCVGNYIREIKDIQTTKPQLNTNLGMEEKILLKINEKRRNISLF